MKQLLDAAVKVSSGERMDYAGLLNPIGLDNAMACVKAIESANAGGRPMSESTRSYAALVIGFGMAKKDVDALLSLKPKATRQYLHHVTKKAAEIAIRSPQDLSVEIKPAFKPERLKALLGVAMELGQLKLSNAQHATLIAIMAYGVPASYATKVSGAIDKSVEALDVIQSYIARGL